MVRNCSEAGYVCIESGFIYDSQPSQHIREVCARHRIRYVVGNRGYDNTFRDEKKFIQTVNNVKETGAGYIICSGVKGSGKTTADYIASAKVFNQVGKIATDLGLTFCYHNHAFEFVPLENKTKGPLSNVHSQLIPFDPYPGEVVTFARCKQWGMTL